MPLCKMCIVALQIKGQVEEFGTDTDKELKTGDEIVTGVRKNKD